MTVAMMWPGHGGELVEDLVGGAARDCLAGAGVKLARDASQIRRGGLVCIWSCRSPWASIYPASHWSSHLLRGTRG